jgi:hypothetical protein
MPVKAKAKPKRKAPAKKKNPAKRRAPAKRRPRAQAGGGMLGDMYSYLRNNRGKIATGALVGIGGISAGLAGMHALSNATNTKRQNHIQYNIHGDYGRDYGSTYGSGMVMPPDFFQY